MATTTITQLPIAISLDGSEKIEIVQNGTSKQATSLQIANITVPSSAISTVYGDNNQTLTIADLVGGFIVGSPTLNVNYTTPDGSNIDTAFNLPPVNSYFSVTIFTTTANSITLVGGSGVTLVGSGATAASANSYASFNFVKTAASTYSVYRVG